MASFRVHLYAAAAVSSVSALGAYSLGWAGPQQTQALFALGVLGGLLPDIDAENSRPVRGFFTLLGIALAFAMSFSFVGQVSLLLLGGIWALVVVTVRFGVYELFARFTVHRGSWHSWLGVLLAGLGGANLAFHVLGMSAWDSWLAGLFVALGYLTHLCLDEIASVDLLGNRVRRSFGTALKPFSITKPRASVGMLAAIVALSLASPPVAPLKAVADHYGLGSQLLLAQTVRWEDWTPVLRGFVERAAGYR
jgi:hypothetical protein